ncbi:MAG: NAD(P)/FAD-dependent oxidoreductase [Rubrivivax sp.]|nr:NAD(P)/FAD-dependent oxidoreductase [Rubrivivax sp.]
MRSSTHIVIVGGGFAGTTLARALAAWRARPLTLTLVSDESTTTFNPMLPEAVGASVFPEQVVAPLREMLDLARGDRFVMGRVTRVRPGTRTLTCETLAGTREIAYDELVLAFGNRARLDLLPGMALHALPLKTVGDALHIRNVVLRRLACIELEPQAERRAAIGHFVIVGGGFSGVEVAGELVDCLSSIRRYYPRVAAHELRVTLLHDGSRLLPEMSERLAAAALKSLSRRGVQVLLGARAESIDEGGVTLAGGRRLAAHTVVSTIGTRPNSLAQDLGLATERGRIVVRPDLSVPGQPGLWALGDCALVPNAHDGKPSPPTAQFAVRQAKHLADNLTARACGEPTRPFAARPRGMMAAIGRRNGVAEVFGFGFSGLPAWLLWRAYYLSQMPTLRRKLRIWVEWTWGMFFPADITHLRFTRSADLPLHEGRSGV